MRKLMIVGLIGASLGLASCGVKASIDQAVSSLGSSPDLQLHFTGTVSGAGTTEAQKVLSDISVDALYSNPTGAALSQAGANANTEIVINAGSQTLADIREVNSDYYVEVNITAASSIPGVNLPTNEVSALQLVFGGHWYEFPKSLVNSLVPKPSAAAKAQSVKDVAAERSILDDLSKLIAATSYTTLPNGGYSQTGTLASVVNAVLPTIQSLSSTTIPSPTVTGTYTLTVTGSGSTATGGSITISGASGLAVKGVDSVGINVTVGHASDSIAAPAGATVVTKSLIKGLLAQAG